MQSVMQNSLLMRLSDRVPAHSAIALASGAAVVALGYDADGRERAMFVADAATITAATVNLMARCGRGVIACAVDHELADRLHLSLIPHSALAHRPHFLRSVEAAVDVATGISADDRARTLRTLGRDGAGPENLVSPGHIMPNLVSRACRADEWLPNAILPLARTVAPLRAAAWCDVLDEDGDVADHDQACRIAAEAGAPLLLSGALSVAGERHTPRQT